MSGHPTVQHSFFIRFLLITALLGNFYIMLQSICHIFNFHSFDLYVRWYAFRAAPLYNIGLLIGATVTIYGAFMVRKNGIAGFKIYFLGKFLSLLAFILLTILEYRVSNIPYPLILIPVLTGIEAIYPMLLYISLRKSKARRL